MKLANIEIYNRQKVYSLEAGFLERLHALSGVALKAVWAQPEGPEHVLSELELIEVSLIDDCEIDRVHWEFMAIPGATDVITFHHGEILISVETTQRQASEHGESFERELFRYVVHGLLHLHGYTDLDEENRYLMHKIQERIIENAWK